MIPGVFAATLTPLKKDYSCDCEALTSHCLDLIARGCQGVVLFGTTGEGTLFSVRERNEALRAVLRHVPSQKVIVNATASNLDDVVEITKAAATNKCLAVLIAPPFYYTKVSDEGLFSFYSEVIKRVTHPILLYSIPQFTHIPITLELVRKLIIAFPEVIVGLKESFGDLDFTKQVIKSFPKLKVFVGHETQIIESVAIGGSGTICGLANLFPELICSLFNEGKGQETVEEISQVLSNYSFIPAMKAELARKKGQAWERLRPPLLSIKKAPFFKFNKS